MQRDGDDDTPPPRKGRRSDVARDLTNLAGAVGAISAQCLEAARLVDTLEGDELVDYVTRLARDFDEIGPEFAETARTLEGLVTTPVEIK